MITKAEEILSRHINTCTCDEAYVKRRLTDPTCFWCDNVDGVTEAMKEYALSCLEKASENAVMVYQDFNPRTLTFESLPGRHQKTARFYSDTKVVTIDKASITNPDNLV